MPLPAVLGLGSLAAWVINALRVLFASRLGTWVAGALAWLGLSFATHEVAIEPTVELLESYMTGAGGSGEYAAVALAYMGVMKFDQAVSMVISAVATRQGISAGKLFLAKRGAA